MLSEDTENIADKQETGPDILSYKGNHRGYPPLVAGLYCTVFNLFVMKG